MSALKIGNVLRAGLMTWAMFMDLNVRSGDNYVNIGQSLVGTSGAVALAALVCLLALSWADERLPKAGLRVRLAALFLGVWQVIAVSVVNTNDLNQPFLSGSQKLKAAVLALGMAFATASVHNALMSYTAYFAVIAAIMLAALVIFILTVREVEWAQQMQRDSVEYGVEDTAEDGASPQEERKLTRGEVKSLIFILLSIVLWFFGYNAVTSKYSVYASNILHKDYNLTLIIAQAAAIVAYLPVGVISSRVGRKRAIQAGVILLTVAFGVAGFLHAESPTLLMNAMFALAGIAWATINVNSFPMVVELSSGGNVGKYTGFYYTASMAAQVATPMLSGLLMDKWGMRVLFPYATVFVALAFATMLMVHHGDSKPQMKLGLEALQDSEMD